MPLQLEAQKSGASELQLSDINDEIDSMRFENFTKYSVD